MHYGGPIIAIWCPLKRRSATHCRMPNYILRSPHTVRGFCQINVRMDGESCLEILNGTSKFHYIIGVRLFCTGLQCCVQMCLMASNWWAERALNERGWWGSLRGLVVWSIRWALVYLRTSEGMQHWARWWWRRVALEVRTNCPVLLTQLNIRIRCRYCGLWPK